MTNPQSIMGEFSTMSHASTQLQAISDQQGVIMRQLGDTLDQLAGHLQGQAGQAMQSLGDRLITIGNQFSTKFASHSDLMKNNVALLNQSEDHNVSTIRAVEGLTG
ncbi:MAG: hypothetical protein J2P17_31975 [Mycobacterium sp.]|nr:hypothetical protein [Mycobacterium sp.]